MLLFQERSMIVVTGASGTNGRAVLEVLRGRGVKARALVRNKGKAGELAASGVELVEGDLSVPASLEKAFAGADAVFSLAPGHPDTIQWFGNVFDAAKRAGVKHIVKYSAMNALDTNGELMRQHAVSDR